MWKKLCYCEEEKIVYMGMWGLAISLSLPRKKHCGEQNRSSMSKNLCDGQLRAGYWFPASSAVVKHQLVCRPEISIKMPSNSVKCLTLIISWSVGLVFRALKHIGNNDQWWKWKLARVAEVAILVDLSFFMPCVPGYYREVPARCGESHISGTKKIIYCQGSQIKLDR